MIKNERNRSVKLIIVMLVTLIIVSITFNMIFLFDRRDREKGFDFYSISPSICELMVEKNGNVCYATAFCFSTGLFITSYHTFENFNDVDDSISLTLISSKKENFTSSLIGYNKEEDIAILKSEVFQPDSIDIINKKPKTGDMCYCFGNANGLGISLYSGMVSNPNISLLVDGKKQNFIQCKSDVYPGCSGGCLLNKIGECIGMISFRTIDKDGNPVVDFSYSIPSERLLNVTKRILDDISKEVNI